jgi:filamentous hemagglutinin family protein
MNRIYRLCWNRANKQWVAASELASSATPVGVSRTRVLGHRSVMLSVMAASLFAAGMAHAGSGPMGGQIIGGSGQIQQVGNTTTIVQNSPTLNLNWQSFNIASNQTVNFLQPGSSAIAINRIFSSTPSEIYGHLNANGQVWLINPNGVLFGQSAQVNVGGLVASTLDLDNSSLSSGSPLFSGSGKGSVINQGSITAAKGGYVALLANQVSNQGAITAQLGTVALAGGSAVTLTFSGEKLLHVQVDQSTLNNLAENRQLIVADGGQVIMTAGAKDALLASAVNNTGIVQAQTVQNQNGTITLLGGMTDGSVNVGGTLDASAPNGGSGGSIETSAAHFNLASDTHITASAPQGKAGTWLVDPVNLTINSTSATTISNTLNGGTNVTEQTTESGASGVGVQSSGAGDIDVESGISWSNANASLTLSAYNAINVDAPISGSGKVFLQSGVGQTGATSANITISAAGSIVGGAGVTLASGNNFINSGGSTAVSTGTSAAWLIYSTNPTLDTPGGLTPNFIQYNAPYSTAPAASGNGFLYSLAPTLTVSAISGSLSKVYDGTTNALLSSSNLTTSGLVNGNRITVATGTYASSNVGSNISVSSPSSIAGFTITDSTGNIPVYGYALSGSTVSANIGAITPALLTASIVGDPTKVYDGTTTATLSAGNYSISGFVAGQGATVNQPSSVSYGAADAGSQTITATLSSTNFVANSGTALSNYTLPTLATGLGTISKAPLLISGLLATDKTYDGTTTDTLNVTNANIYGVIAPDAGQVSLDSSGASGTFASPNVGQNISVAAGGFSLTGAKANDYTLVPPTDLTANITAKTLTISGVTATDKVYDGTTGDTLSDGGATLVGVVASDSGAITLSTSGAAGTFSQSDVGSNLSVSASGFVLSGSAAGNYTLAQPSGLTANITPATLAIAFAGNPSKIYDGTTAATLTSGDFTISGFVAGQSAVVSQSPATYASANAGSGIGVTATLQPSDFTPGSGTSLSNYTFASTVSGTGTVTPAPLTVSIINNPTKVYDGLTNATLSSGNYSISGLINGESITLGAPPATGLYASPNAGVEGVSAVLTSGDFTAGSGTLLSNYALPTAANGLGTITPKPVGISIDAAITGNPTKVYDGTTNATLLPADFTLTGFVNGDTAVVNQNISGTYATQNVGSQPISATLQKSDFNFTGTDEGDYTFPVIAYGTGTITPALLTAVIVNNPTKVYDGTVNAVLTSSNFQLNGFVAGEGATVSPTTTFTYASANAGSGITITGNLTVNNYTATGSTLLSNYTLATTASGPGTINQAPLYVTGVYATNKVYDTNTNDTLNVGAAGLAGLVATDAGNVTLNTSTSGAFSQANVGNNLAVSASGFSLSGSAASNYALQPITGLIANITPATLTIGGVTANSKSYDGTTAATLNDGSATLNGVLGSDNVTLSSSGAAGQFVTANAGNNLAVTTSGFTLGGNQASNYILSQPTGLTASINPAVLSVSITGSPSKAYDGTNSATLTASDYTITGFVSGQGANIPQSATANYASPNAGTGLTVNSTLVTSDWLANAGTNLSNYVLPSSATGNNGIITPYVLNLSGTRIYDANTDADADSFGSGGVLTGLHGDTLTVSGSGIVSSKNVGTYTGSAQFNLNNLALTGNGSALASNYTLVGGTDTLIITPATLTVIDTVAANKVYDNNTNATLSGSQLQGVLGSDNVTLGNDSNGTFATKNVGTGIAVSTNMTISGSDASNYIIQQPAGIAANITPLAITVTATGTNRVYNGSVNDTVTLAGTLSGDQVTIGDTSATFADPNVGTGKTVTVDGITLSGVSAGNYTLLNNTTTTTANVTPVILNLTGTRVYDAGTDADANLFGTAGVLNGVNGETLTVSGSGIVSSKNVGTYTGSAQFNLNNLALTGNGSALASNYTLVGGTDTLTITPAILTVIDTVAANKVYDNTTNATLSGSQLEGVLGSDNVTLGNDSTGTFATKNVGTGIAVSTNMSISGSDASNYIIEQPAGITANITPLPITVTATGTNRVYNGSVNDAVTLSGTLSGDQVTIGDTSATFGDPNVGTGKTVTVDGISLSGASAGNYTLLNNTTTTTANITPVILDLTGTRVYDTGTDANANLFGTGGVLTGVNGETLTVSGSGIVSSKNVGTYTGSAQFNLNNLLLTGNGSALASNYTLAGGTDTLTITPAPLTVAGTVAANKTYDGNTTASLSGSQLLGVLGSDNVTLGNDSTGTFATANAGNGIGVSTAMTVGGTDASNYFLTQPTGITANINPYILNLTGTRTYDGATDANAGLFGTSGVLTGLNGDTLRVSGSGIVSSKNVGVYTGSAQFNLNNLSLSGNGSALASNYTLVGGTDTLTITPAQLTVIDTVAANKTYDGNTTATLSGSQLQGLFGSDSVTLGNDSTGTFATANAGNGIAVSTTMSISGADASNYTLVQPTGVSANINPYALNLSGTRVYDAGTDADAALFGNSGVLTGLNGDTLTLTGSGIVSSKNVGTYTGSAQFNLNNLSLSGNGSALASNYTLVGGTDTLGITPASLTVTGTVAANKTYDGNTTASLSGSQLQGVLGSDNVTLGNDSTGTFATANAGNGIGVSTAITVGGTDAGNYVLTQPTGISANINPYILNLTGTRTYNGTNSANAALFGTNAVLTGLNGDTLTVSGSGITSSGNVGVYTGTAFNLNNLSLTGNGTALTSNYTLVGGIDTLTITPAPLTVIDTVAANKTYDGNTTATLSGSQLQGLFGNDAVTLGNDSAGTFATANAGNGIAVGTAMTIGGADASNYTLIQPTGVSANINPYALNLSGTRVYDAGTDANANLFGNNGVLTGLNGDTLTLSGSGIVSSKNVGTYTGSAQFNPNNLSLSGNGSTLASNYTLVGGTDTLAITPLAITVSATGENKTYDGTTTASVTLSTSGVLAGDTLNVSDGAANFSSPNAGNQVSIAVTGITGSGADAGNYVFNTTASTSATINPYVLNLTGTRVYNGTTGADASLFGNNGVLSGINGQTVTLTGTGTLSTKNVGSELPFASNGLTGFALSGNGSSLASNYTLAGGTDWVTITPAILTVVGTTTTNRVYNGTTTDTLNGATLSGVFGGDSVVLGNDTIGQFNNKNVGNSKPVSTDMTVSGADAGNYILIQPTGLVANITPLPITVTATGTNRIYNGQDGDKVVLSTNGILAGDQVGLTDGSANFASPYVGNDKPVTVTGIATTGADAGNYLILDPTTVTEANITNIGFVGSGVQGSWIAQLEYGMQPRSIATPYGSADMDTVSEFIGNQKLKHRPIERNRIRSDFHSGMSLQSENGGVQLPTDASP